ncbi:MAG: ABC transporter permease [Bdellovibrionales bacterium]|nr:ABC transporter permease [Bdellovibrionales bacterium]
MKRFATQIQIIVRLAALNVLRNWRHSLATIFAISLGFTAVSLFDGFMTNIHHFAVESYVTRGMLGHLVIDKKGAMERLFEDQWGFALDEPDQKFLDETLRADPRVAVVARFLLINGIVSNAEGNPLFFGTGYDVLEGTKMRGDRWAWNTVVGKPLHLADQNAAAIGIGLARRMNCEFTINAEVKNPDGSYVAQERPFVCPSPTVQLSVTTENAQVNALEFKPVGGVDLLMRQFNDRFVMLPLKQAQSLMDTNRITRYSVLLHREQDQMAVVTDLRNQAAKGGFEIDVTPWLDHSIAAVAKSGNEILGIFRSLFLAVVVVIAAMSVANTMMKSLNERIQEIGTMRSYGFWRSDIIHLFLWEGFILGLISCGLGLILTVVAAAVISNSGMTFNTGVLSDAVPLKISLSLGTWLKSLVGLCLITAGTSWLVSRRVSKMVVADLLRYVA